MLKNLNDILCNGLGSYRNRSCEWYYYSGVGDQLTIHKRSHVEFEIKQLVFKHKRYSSLTRRIVEFRRYRSTVGADNEAIFSLLVYKISSPVQTFDRAPHGNSKVDTLFPRTKKFCLDKNHRRCRQTVHGKFYEQLFDEAGGIFSFRTDVDYYVQHEINIQYKH